MVSLETASALPEDLRSRIPALQVLALATEAAGLVTQDPAFRDAGFEQFRVPMMLTLLGYCYATDSFSSDDVEWTAANEEVLRDTVGFPDAQAIRRFRRAYRPWILQCLIHILKQAMAQPAEKSFETVRSETSADIVGWASRKIQLAVMMDAAAAD